MLGLNKSIGNYGKALLKLISLQMCFPLFDDRKRKEFELIFNFFTNRKSLGKLNELQIERTYHWESDLKIKSLMNILQFAKQFESQTTTNSNNNKRQTEQKNEQKQQNDSNNSNKRRKKK